MIFLTEFAKKEYFRSKIEKWKSTAEFCIFELDLVPNSSLSWELCFLEQIFQKRLFTVKNGKSDHGYWILHLLIFLTKFSQKGYLRSKTKNSHLPLKLFRTGADRHNDILISLLLLVADITRLHRCFLVLTIWKQLLLLYDYCSRLFHWKIAFKDALNTFDNF